MVWFVWNISNIKACGNSEYRHVASQGRARSYDKMSYVILKLSQDCEAVNTVTTTHVKIVGYQQIPAVGIGCEDRVPADSICWNRMWRSGTSRFHLLEQDLKIGYQQIPFVGTGPEERVPADSSWWNRMWRLVTSRFYLLEPYFMWDEFNLIC